MTALENQDSQHSTNNAASNVSGKTRISITDVTELCQQALQEAGYTSDQSIIITDHLIDAELRGHPFAGLARALSTVPCKTP